MVSFSVFIDTELNEENKSTVYTRTQKNEKRQWRHSFFIFRFFLNLATGIKTENGLMA